MGAARRTGYSPGSACSPDRVRRFRWRLTTGRFSSRLERVTVSDADMPQVTACGPCRSNVRRAVGLSDGATATKPGGTPAGEGARLGRQYTDARLGTQTEGTVLLHEEKFTGIGQGDDAFRNPADAAAGRKHPADFLLEGLIRGRVLPAAEEYRSHGTPPLRK